MDPEKKENLTLGLISIGLHLAMLIAVAQWIGLLNLTALFDYNLTVFVSIIGVIGFLTDGIVLYFRIQSIRRRKREPARKPA